MMEPDSPNPFSQTSFNPVSPQERSLRLPPARLQRPRPTELEPVQSTFREIPLDPKAAAISRRQSRNSLINLFGRSKSTTATPNVVSLRTLEESDEALPKARGTTALKPPTGSAKSNTRTPLSPASINALQSPISVRSQSFKASRKISVKSSPSLRASTSWDPPPLFQAYPQSVKHANLEAPSLGAEVILKLNKGRGANSLEAPSGGALDEITEYGDEKGKSDKARRHKRKLSGSLSKADWVRKIYILVTSGYLLQYTSEGTFDRLPEKMMGLSKDSVVFVSDAIPGKHWVLQISHASTDDGDILVESSKSFFGRLGFRTADAKRATGSFLLVFDNPKEMESWLITIRKEIESLGGRIRPDSPSQPAARPTTQLDHKLSQRYLVRRETLQSPRDRWSEAPTDRSKVFSFATSERGIPGLRPTRKHQAERADRNRTSWAPTEAPSLSTTTTSELEDVRASRDSTVYTGPRHSYYGHSPTSSPTAGSFVLPELPPFEYPEASVKHGQALPTISAWPADGDPQCLSLDATKLTGSQPLSRGGTSPGTPNFSVPSFSKRFSHSTASLTPLATPPLSIRIEGPESVSQPSSRGGSDLDQHNRSFSTIEELPSPSTIISPPKGTFYHPETEAECPISPSPVDEKFANFDSEVSYGLDEDNSLPTPLPDAVIRPKRFSSLQHLQSHLPGRNLHPASPPPIEELPPIPIGEDYFDERHSPQKVDDQARSPLRPWRPMSMQVRSHPSTPSSDYRRRSHQPKHLSLHPSTSHDQKSPAEPPKSAPPQTQQQVQDSDPADSLSIPNSIPPRKSMPNLMTTAPPAPPPNCPLPELPPGRPQGHMRTRSKDDTIKHLKRGQSAAVMRQWPRDRESRYGAGINAKRLSALPTSDVGTNSAPGAGYTFRPRIRPRASMV